MSPPVNKTAATGFAGLIEGGPFHCNKDGFETHSVEEWNEHGSQAENGSTHLTEQGNVRCMLCRERVVYSNLPFVKFQKNGVKRIMLECPECNKAKVGNAKIMRVSNPSI